jgi:hypothetical protein
MQQDNLCEAITTNKPHADAACTWMYHVEVHVIRIKYFHTSLLPLKDANTI